MTDVARVRKIYKLTSGGGGGGGGGKRVNGVSGEDEDRRELEVLVLGSMALRGSTN
jgi:EKC/KEOPS complex subunit CGI121/TPRKB